MPTDKMVMAIRNKIYSQNLEKPFVEKFVKYAGFPIWDKAIITSVKNNKLSYEN